jgi:hypothetical protein
MFDAVCDIRISSGATISYNDFDGCDNELASADLADRASMISNAPPRLVPRQLGVSKSKPYGH